MSIKNNISRENAERLDLYVKNTSKGLSHIPADLERDLIEVYRTNPNAREKEKALSLLVSYNITIFADITISVLNNMRGGDRIDPLDLMQVGVSTFMKKLNTWDSSKKTKMITYYYRDMKTQMQRFVMANAFSIKQGSVFLQHLAYNISKFKNTYILTHKSEPSIQVIAEELGVSKNTIQLCIKSTSLTIIPAEEQYDLYTTSAYPEKYSPIEKILKQTLNRHSVTDDEFNVILDCFDGITKTLPENILNKIN